MTKLLIDGDVIAYRASAAAEKTRYMVSGPLGRYVAEFDSAAEAKEAMLEDGLLWSRKELEPEDKAILIVNAMIGDIRAHYDSEDPEVHIFLSPSVGNYREQLATRAKYKGNRDHVARPTHHRACVARLVALGGVTADGQEADDALGIAASEDKGSIICSIDKDLLQIPGRHYDFVKKEETTVTPKEGTKFFYQQVLSGDDADNVPGIKGVGAVKASKLLEKAESPLACWLVCLAEYKKAYGDKGAAFALETARLVYVRKKPKEMWVPPTR